MIMLFPVPFLEMCKSGPQFCSETESPCFAYLNSAVTNVIAPFLSDLLSVWKKNALNQNRC